MNGKFFPNDVPNEYERKELRIVKIAIAKSFINNGQSKLDLDKETEEKMEKWIKWIYRNEEKDWRLIKEKEQPF